jgi:peptidoglycan/xylan/chitin deacetylase (PgdA/CDA1 family)
MMYHRVLRHPDSPYDVTPRSFLHDLERLYRDGYRPVRAVDLVTRHIDLPAGRSPVVLTFDDSSREQFSYTSDGKVDRHSAIGMLLSFAASHPGFRPVATMYVNRLPFATSEGPKILRFLFNRGFELGNHTFSHADLSTLTRSGVQREMALGERVITSAVPEAQVQTMALPLGVWPHRHSLVVRGAWHGIRYRNLGVMLVGAGPSPSPYSKAFDPLGVPRIRPLRWNGKAPNYGSEFWFDYLRAHPEERYVSDGDPAVVSYPKRLSGDIDKRFARRSNRY